MSRKEKGGLYFRELFNYAADGILIGNDDGIIEIANAAFYEISGLVTDQVVGKHISELPFDPESLKQEPFRYDLLEKGLTIERQRLLIKPDQQKVYVEMRTRKLPNGGFQSLLRNVTERKQAEEALTNSEQKYHQLYSLMRLMADNMPDMLWAKDLNKKYLFVNKSICKKLLNAKDTSEPIGKTDMFFALRERESRPLQPDYHTFGELCTDSDSITLKEMKQMQFDEFGNVGGRFLYLDVHKAPIFDEQGKVIGVVGSARDITSRKRAEKALSESEELNRLLLTNIPDIVLRSDLNGNITFVNESGLKKYHGFTAEYFIGKSMFSFIADKDKQRILKNTKLMFEKPLGVQEYTLQLNENLLIDSEVNGDIIRDSENQPTGMVFVIRDISERKKAEETLRESEEKHRTLVEQMQEGLVVDNLDGIILFTNPMFCKMTGYTEHELIGRSGYELMLKPEDIPVMQERDEARRRNLSEQYEMDIITKSGEIRTFWFHAVPVMDKNGEVTGSMSTVIDITEHNLALENLRVTKDTYLSIFNSVSEAIYVLDDKNTFIDVNRGAEIMYGYTRQELVGRSPETVSAPGLNDLRSVEKIHKEVSESGISQRFEFWGQRKSGEIFPKEVTVNKGSYFGKDSIIATARDITEHKMAEDALLKESKLQDILMRIASKYINIPLHTVEPAIQGSLEEIGRFVRADRVYIFDYLWEKGICRNTFEWCAEGIEPQINELQDVPLEIMQWWVDIHLKGETLYIKDVFALDEKDGVRLLLEPQDVKSLIAIPMMRDKYCVGFVGFDSVKKRHEYSKGDIRLLEVFSSMLVNIGLRREVEKDLTVAKDKAEAGDRLKSAFMNNISHEIRTPLNGILGFGQMMTQPGLSEAERKEYLKILQKSSDRLINTITDYMDISLVVSNNLAVNKKPFLLNDLMESVYTRTKQACETRELECDREFHDGKTGLTLNTDQELLGKALRHLLNNAVRFTGKGKVSLGYRLLDNSITFFVSDTGIGIEKDALDKIFDAFVQEDMRTTRRFEGSGLGLSITKGIVEKLGGKITIESQKDKGTTVRFTLPFDGEAMPSGSTQMPAVEKPVDNKPLVLVAEDEYTNYLYLEVLMKKHHIMVLHAKDGSEAVEMCRKHPDINLVFMDIKMPVMDGLEATKRIKEFRRDLPIIAITAYAQTGDEFRIREAGCDVYLAKPVKKESLLKILAAHHLLQR